MALKIRLRRQGRTNRPFYRLVVADARSPRDGKYVEVIGWYNPLAHKEDEELEVKADRAEHWIDLGAQPTDKVVSLLRRAAPELMAKTDKRLADKQSKRSAQRKSRRKAVTAAK